MTEPAPPTWPGVVERLLAAAAVVGAAIYVLLNALYIEYLDDFGLRPEDVGIDRLAVLGRAAWIALFGLAVGAIAAAITMYVSGRRMRLDSRTNAEQPRAGSSAEQEEDAKQRHTARARSHHLMQRATVHQFYALGIIAVAVALLVGFLALRVEVERSANKAKSGERVGGLGWIVEFVDIRALPARVAWVSDQPKPSFVTDEDYLYLGRGDQVVALLTCEGRTIMLRPDDVVVQVLEYDSDESEPESVC